MSRSSRSRVHLVTQAHKPRSEDIGYRQRRYLLMMGIRIGCFLLAILVWTQGAGWFAAIPAAGAIVIPYFAVVFANGGREPNDTRGFQEYQPGLPGSHPAPADPQPYLSDMTITARQADPRMGGPQPARAQPEAGPVPSAADGRQAASSAAQSGTEKRSANG